jgi:hypothetical protein
MSSETSSHERPDDIEARMRQRLGLNTTPGTTPVPPPADDPLRGARQAIRSQAAAREYVERQLAHAEATIQDLRGKLHHARREKDAAVDAARTTAATKADVDRTLAAIESALAAEKVARDRGDRALREAQASIRLLQAKLDAAVQSLEAAKAELASERHARQKAENDWRRPKIAPQIAALAIDDNPAVLPICNSTESVAAQPIHEGDRSEEVGNVAVAEAIGVAAVVPPARRPVGRPRKTESTPPVQASSKQARKVQAPTTAISPKVRTARPSANDHAPIQWWVEGWNRRKR